VLLSTLHRQTTRSSKSFQTRFQNTLWSLKSPICGLHTMAKNIAYIFWLGSEALPSQHLKHMLPTCSLHNLLVPNWLNATRNTKTTCMVTKQWELGQGSILNQLSPKLIPKTHSFLNTSTRQSFQATLLSHIKVRIPRNPTENISNVLFTRYMFNFEAELAQLFKPPCLASTQAGFCGQMCQSSVVCVYCKLFANQEVSQLL